MYPPYLCMGRKFFPIFSLSWLLLTIDCSCLYGSQSAIFFNENGALKNAFSLVEDSCFTVDFWVYSDSLAQNSRLFYCGPDSSTGFGLNLTTTLVGDQTYGTLVLGGISEIATGNAFRIPYQQWIHVAVTRNSKEWDLYDDASLVGRSVDTSHEPDSILTIGIHFAGGIARMRFWNKTLTRSQVVTSMCSGHLLDSSLIAEYSGSSLGRVDSIPDTRKNNPALVANGNIIENVIANFPAYSLPPAFTLLTFPSHMQFFARDADDSARIQVSGELTPELGDSLVLDLYKNDSLIQSSVRPASEQFTFIEAIHCELSEYTIRLFLLRSGARCFIAEAADLVCGDVFLIDGQSNAHPAVDGYTWQNPFARTIGIQTSNLNLHMYEPADTLWGISSGTGWGNLFSGPYFVGAWARWMQEGIANEWNVPTCVINGAAGGSTIEQHMRNDEDPSDSTTIYGRLLYRFEKSQLQHKIRAIFWYQGEWDSGFGYRSKFQKLYDEWNDDYFRSDSSPVIHFIFQTRPNICGYGDDSILEVQREIGDSMPNFHSISTAWVNGYDGCHYYWYGYEAIGQQVLRVLGKYLYHSADTANVDPPDIWDARYTSPSHNVIAIRFHPFSDSVLVTSDTMINGSIRTMTDAFEFDGQHEKVDSVRVQSNVLYLFLHEASNAAALDYLPNQTYNGDTTVYSGPWIENGADVGALAFSGIPIQGPASCADVLGPKGVSLSVTYQNPGLASVDVQPGVSGYVRIELYNMLGECQAMLYEGWMDAGSYMLSIPERSSPQFVRVCAGHDVSVLTLR